MFGVEEEDIEILDDPLLKDGMNEVWPVDVIAHIVLERLRRRRPDMVLFTFCVTTSQCVCRIANAFHCVYRLDCDF